MTIFPLGDGAALIRLGDTIGEAVHRRVRAAQARLGAHSIRGITEVVPGMASIAVHYDSTRLPDPPFEHLRTALLAALHGALEGGEGDVLPPPARLVEIPVRYGGEHGPDLDDVARHHGLSTDEVVRLHAGADYLVYMLGFAPGFPYLGGLPERLATPRLATPRGRVPAGSVGLGGAQTGIYPLESPGGWRIIGRTPLRLFTPESPESPTLLRMGDRVRFRAVTPAEFSALERGA